MEIRLLTDAGEKDPESHDADHYLRHVLSDGIKKIQIFTETAFNEEFPAGAEVTSCFMTIQRRLLKISRQIILLMEGISIDR